MSFLDTLSQMGVLFTLVIIGYICNKLKLMHESFDKSLSALIINVTAPCIILSSVMGDKLPSADEILPVLTLGIMTLLIMLIIGTILTKFLHRDKDKAGIYRFMYAFGNINFIGLPVVSALFGTYTIFYISILTIPFNIFIFLLGRMFIASCNNTTNNKLSFNWRMIVSPALSSTYLVIVLVYFQIQTPKVLAEAISLAGYMTIPASLMVIGSALANIKIREMLSNYQVYIMSIFKLLIVPIMIYVIYNLSHFDKKYTDVLVILSAMPVASYGTMLCLKEGVDPKTMAQGTFISTFFAIITIPILSLLL